MVFVLYAYQGVVAGFGTVALPNQYAGLGATPEAVGGHLALVGLPWVLQPLWGPVVDRFGAAAMGRRRPWMLGALAASLLALCGLLAVPPGVAALPLASAVLLAHSAAAALLDTATDALVIDRVPANHLGAANACSRAGFAVGGALGAWLFAHLLSAAGLRGSALVLLGFGAAALLLPLLVREAAGDALLSARRRPGPAAEAVPSFRRLLRRLGLALRRRQALTLLGLCVAEEFAGAVFGVRLGVALVQEGGWDAAALSRWQAGLALASGTVGALLVGRWSDRVGAHRALAALLLLCAAAHLVAAGLLGTGATVVLGLSSVTPALVFVALAPAVMQACRGPAAATRFALFMAALNGGGVVGAVASGPVGTVLPLWATALAAAAVFAGCAAVAWRPHRLFRVRPGAA